MPALENAIAGIPNPTKQEYEAIKRFVRQEYPTYLLHLTPDGIEAKINAEVTDLASAKATLKILARAICINSRVLKYLMQEHHE